MLQKGELTVTGRLTWLRICEVLQSISYHLKCKRRVAQCLSLLTEFMNGGMSHIHETKRTVPSDSTKAPKHAFRVLSLACTAPTWTAWRLARR